MQTKIHPNIITACAQCGLPVSAVLHVFHVGSSDSPHTRIQYEAALYHNTERQINFCDAHCATAYKNTSEL